MKSASSISRSKLATLTTSLAAEYAKQGKQWDVEVRQIAAERQLLAELNLSLGERPSQLVVPDPTQGAGA